jgi:proteasome accessory factor C
MTDTAAAQLRRILTLIPNFADDQDHSLDEIAETLGTTRQQLLKDFDSLSQRFDVAGFVESVRINVEQTTASVMTSEFYRPMRLTMPELCVLELGLTMLRLERTPAEHAIIDRALVRLRQTITQLPSNEGHEDLRAASLQTAGRAEHLTVLREAVQSHRAVRLTYRSGGATTSTEREICPHTLLHSEQMWYVVTLGENNSLRYFRLDRIEDVELLEACFEPDGTVVDRVMQEGRPFASDTARRMTVHYSPTIARWVAEREGATLAADGSLTMEHPVADETWAVRHVLQYGAEAEVLAPAELRASVMARLEAMAEG